MNSARMSLLAAMMICISACKPISSAPLPSATTQPDSLPAPTQSAEPAQPLLRTELGDFVIASARLVDEANGVKAEAGEKILLMILTQPDLTNLDPSTFSLEAFGNMTHDPNTEIYILGNDGSRTISTMGGWVGDEFDMGFKVRVDAEPYTLYWTGNSPLVLSIKE
ncbi:MAG: hypothetical protein ACXW4Q_17100 [Anaerolineales bacterium]